MGEALREFRSQLHAMLPSLQTDYAVESLGLFGSYATGTEHPGSDLDVLVSFSVTPSLFRLIELENRMTDALGVKVDLVLRRALKPRIGERVLQEVVAV